MAAEAAMKDASLSQAAIPLGYTPSNTNTNTNTNTNKNPFSNLTTTPNRDALKSNDRARASKRPLFAYFLTTYTDTHATHLTPPGSAAKLTKQEAIDEAKAFFGAEFSDRYDRLRREGMQVIGTLGLWNGVRAWIKGEGALGDELGYGVKGVKSAIVGAEFEFLDDGEEMADRDCRCEVQVDLENARLAIMPTNLGEIDGKELKNARLAFKEMKYGEVLEWAKVNWRMVGERQKKIDQEESVRKLAAKIENERLMVVEVEGRRSP